jgi:hypothetical protein
MLKFKTSHIFKCIVSTKKRIGLSSDLQSQMKLGASKLHPAIAPTVGEITIFWLQL